ncbi:MAG: polysaccharide biosynthesis/export family protein [Planctomycetota bacterium]|jgi:polysaccharide export outer membrane protein
MKALGFVLAALLMVAGCRSNAELNAVAAKARSMMTAPDYVIGEGDEVTIRVLDHEEYRVDAQLVRPDGKIAFPRHGDIQLAGKTVEEAREELEARFQKSLMLTRKPNVYVAVNAFNSKAVTILGEVRRPGRYNYRGQMRVAELLGIAIGTNDLTAAPNQTVLFREVKGTTKMYKVRLKDFTHEGDYTTNYFLRPGDIMYVPRNGWAKASLAINQVLLPVRAVFETIGLGASTTAIFLGAPA